MNISQIEKKIEELKNSKDDFEQELSTEFKECKNVELYSLQDILNVYENILNISNKICSNSCPNIKLYNALIDEKSKRKFNKAQKDFRENYFELKKHIGILSSGIQGEKDTLKALELYNDEIEILQSLCTRIGDYIYEHDFIVINEYGIFSIEVKNNSNHNVYISEQGICNGKNLIKQSKQHFHSLRRCLSDTEYSKVPIHTIIVFTNDKNTVKSEQNTIPICYRYNIDDVIFDSTKYKKSLDKTELKNIKNLIEDKCKDNHLNYTLDFNLESYISKLSNFILNENISQLKKQKDKIEEDSISTAATIFSGIRFGASLLDWFLGG